MHVHAGNIWTLQHCMLGELLLALDLSPRSHSFTRRASYFHIKGQKRSLEIVFCLFDKRRRIGWTPHASPLSLMLPFAALQSLQLLPTGSGCPQRLVCFEWDHQRAPPITFRRLFVSLSVSHRANRECFLLSPDGYVEKRHHGFGNTRSFIVIFA